MPKVSKEEWNEEEIVWLSPRQILALALLINEVQRQAPTNFAISSEILKELRGVKAKLWEQVAPLMLPDEVERSEIEIDPSMGPGAG